MPSIPDEKIATHPHPIWQDQANYIIMAECEIDGKKYKEQLWTKRLGDNHFRICCIPFFLKNVHLGDEVDTTLKDGVPYLLHSVLKPSGHQTFRIWFQKSAPKELYISLPQMIQKHQGLIEWSSTHLLTVSSSSQKCTESLIPLFEKEMEKGNIVWERG